MAAEQDRHYPHLAVYILYELNYLKLIINENN